MDQQLDDSTSAWLQGLAALNAPAMHELSVEACREAFAKLTETFKGEVAVVAEVIEQNIPGPAGALPLRIYKPEGAFANELPVMIYFHGGGWVIGDLDTHDHVCRHFCKEANMVVVNVGYRLAPEHKYPAAIEDCIAATKWVAANAGSIGVDAKRLAVAGDSAGGHLAAVVSQALKELVAFQLLIYPVTDLTLTHYDSREKFGGGTHFLSNADMYWFGGHFLNSVEEAKQAMASPILASDLTGLPSALTVTAGFDPLRDEGQKYAALMEEAGVASTHRCYEGTIHGFVSFPGVLAAGADALAFMVETLHTELS